LSAFLHESIGRNDTGLLPKRKGFLPNKCHKTFDGFHLVTIGGNLLSRVNLYGQGGISKAGWFTQGIFLDIIILVVGHVAETMDSTGSSCSILYWINTESDFGLCF